jgi:hypothetical protein
MIEVDENGQAETSLSQTNQVEPLRLFTNDVISPKNISLPRHNFGQDEYELDQKTIEQHNLRQMSQKYSKRRQEIQKQMSNNGNGGATDRRMDTSGFDIGAGSEVGHSPLSKRMQLPQNQIKVMKNLKSGRFVCHQINEEEKSEAYTMEPDHEFDEEENEDLCRDLIEMEMANDPSAEARSGFQSHRHHLGVNNRGFTPTLMADQEQRHFERSFRQGNN